MSWEYDEFHYPQDAKKEDCVLVRDVRGEWHCLSHKRHFLECQNVFV